ncbi:MAG: hypothetical protein WC766_03600 [Patescibacteria group bacterium]|jgi:hypothetical protein
MPAIKTSSRVVQARIRHKAEINKEVREKLKLYSEDSALLSASLIYDPFGHTETAPIKDTKVKSILTGLDRLQDIDESVFVNFKRLQNIIIFYLLNCEAILKKKNCAEAKKWMSKKRAFYSSKLLNKLDVNELKTKLEDPLFELMEPKTFGHYKSLLKYTRRQYLASQNKFAEHFNRLLYQNGIDADISSRLKTIYSIHQKIIKKNILFSQVLDTIGIRIITKNTEDCYRAMGVILKSFPALSGRIKDYIAIPKENGYRSIHLTIIHKGHPTEIQIRTQNMHDKIQYGKACHKFYKRV